MFSTQWHCGGQEFEPLRLHHSKPPVNVDSIQCLRAVYLFPRLLKPSTFCRCVWPQAAINPTSPDNIRIRLMGNIGFLGSNGVVGRNAVKVFDPMLNF